MNSYDVSIIVPSRNEQGHIASFLMNIASLEAPDGGMEVILADGCSDDATLEEISRLLTTGSVPWPVRVLKNELRTVPAGLNQAIAVASGRVIVRMDVHTIYSSDYILRALDALQRTSADCVGGPWLAVGTGVRGTAIAAAFNSCLAMGNAKSRRRYYEGPADTVYLGVWNRDVLINVGAFDERLTRNQDDELCLRIRERGGLVWQCPQIRSSYKSRAEFRSLARQFVQYGYWRTVVIRQHKSVASFRHVVPGIGAAMFVSLMIGLLLGAVPVLLPIIAMIAYVLFLLGIALTAAGPLGKARPLVPVAALVMHFGYGMGFVLGLLPDAITRQFNSMENLTR